MWLVCGILEKKCEHLKKKVTESLISQKATDFLTYQAFCAADTRDRFNSEVNLVLRSYYWFQIGFYSNRISNHHPRWFEFGSTYNTHLIWNECERNTVLILNRISNLKLISSMNRVLERGYSIYIMHVEKGIIK